MTVARSDNRRKLSQGASTADDPILACGQTQFIHLGRKGGVFRRPAKYRFEEIPTQVTNAVGALQYRFQ